MADTVIQNPIYQGEGKWFRFTITQDGSPMILPETATYAFTIKVNVDDEEAVYEAVTFDTTQRLLGIIRVSLPAATTALMDPGSYCGQLKIIFTAETDVDKSQFVKFKIKKAVTE